MASLYSIVYEQNVEEFEYLHWYRTGRKLNRKSRNLTDNFCILF